MEPEFITYQKFNDAALANELAELIKQHDIPYSVEEESAVFDPTFSYNPLAKDYAVKIRKRDFQILNQLLKEEESKNIGDIDKDYYLFSFANDELMEVITKADEWSAFDIVLARKILTDRGINISEEQINTINRERIEALKIAEPTQTAWIVVGYLCAVLGGALGFFIGWHLSTHKKTLPDGEKVFAYTEKDRRQGKIIFYLSFAGLAMVFILNASRMFYVIY